MNVNMNEDTVQVIIIDISGVYAQIHNQGYFNRTEINDIKEKFCNKQRWRVVVVDK